MTIIPPGGFAGFAQQTPAARLAITGGRVSQRRRRRKTRQAARGKRAMRATRKGSRSRKLKFGSPAWQRKYRVGRFAKKR